MVKGSRLTRRLQNWHKEHGKDSVFNMHMFWGVLVYTMLTTTSAFDRINQFTVYLLLDSDLDATPLPVLGYPKNVLGPAFKHWPVN